MRALLARDAHGSDGVTDTPIHAIHRGSSGMIPLAVKEQGREWKELGALRVGQPLLPELCRVLLQDGYFALNASYGKPAPRVRTVTRERWEPIPGESRGEQLVTHTSQTFTRTNPETGLPFVEHSANTLRWLNVAYADVDCYKHGFTVGDALGAIVDMQDAGQLPPATLFARSGRGLWVLWFLLDVKNPAIGEATIHGQQHNPWTSQRATPRAIRLYARVQGAIVGKLRHLGADVGAIDGPRYAPIPGTEKSTPNSTRVLYWAQATETGPPAYTLRSLADALGLELATREHAVILAAFPDARDTGKNPQKVAAGKRGHRQRWLNTLAELETLFMLRGGRYGDVSRHEAAFFHASALHRSGMTNLAELETRVRSFWEPSRVRAGDTLTDTDLVHVLKQARKRENAFTRLRRETWRAKLAVTPAEATHLDAIRPHVHAPTTKRDRGTRQDAILTAIVETFGGRVPTVRDMAAHLTAIGVPSGNHSTVHRDYKALGYKPAGKPGRPAKLPL